MGKQNDYIKFKSLDFSNNFQFDKYGMRIFRCMDGYIRFEKTGFEVHVTDKSLKYNEHCYFVRDGLDLIDRDKTSLGERFTYKDVKSGIVYTLSIYI